MALVQFSEDVGDENSMLVPDETAFDVLRAVRCCRGTGIACIDGNLDGGCLSPSEVVVLHGESGAAKSTVARNIIVAYIAPTEIGGHGLPAVLIDTEGTFDILLLVQLLSAAAGRHLSSAGCGAASMTTEELVQESLSRLLVLRPAEPLDFLHQIYSLRDILEVNSTTSLLVVDSMSAWQPLAAAFPRSVPPLLREAWKAIDRLQREHCLAVVATFRQSSADLARAGYSRTFQDLALPNACLLDIGRHPAELEDESCFAISRRFATEAVAGGGKSWHVFGLSEAGQVVEVNL
jgi:hypothetical protein